MKKVISVILTGIMLLGLCACGRRARQVSNANTYNTVSTTTEFDPTEDLDVETANCYYKALDYLRFMHFSREGLINQLSSQAVGFSRAQATQAINLLEEYNLVDWNEQAVGKAEDFEFMLYSRQGLIDQLTSQATGFTLEQATYAADQLGY